jgi:hypothetical protein
MHLAKRNKMIIAAIAGVGALTLVAGSAFTAGGVYDNSGAGFVGGTVDQEIFGANITNVAYALGNNDSIDTVTLTFENNITPGGGQTSTIEGKAVTITFKNGNTPVGTYSCTAIASTVSTCTPTPDAAAAADSRAVNKITITVQES